MDAESVLPVWRLLRAGVDQARIRWQGSDSKQHWRQHSGNRRGDYLSQLQRRRGEASEDRYGGGRKGPVRQRERYCAEWGFEGAVCGLADFERESFVREIHGEPAMELFLRARNY